LKYLHRLFFPESVVPVCRYNSHFVCRIWHKFGEFWLSFAAFPQVNVFNYIEHWFMINMKSIKIKGSLVSIFGIVIVYKTEREILSSVLLSGIITAP